MFSGCAVYGSYALGWAQKCLVCLRFLFFVDLKLILGLESEGVVNILTIRVVKVVRARIRAVWSCVRFVCI
jgi:hypothetical protein